jgi:decaprenylphospho-beta-D-ribofuranose 2-oxidase
MMGIRIADLVGLNETDVQDMPIVASAGDIAALWSADGATVRSMAGMRCSQGGHTALAGASMMLMETLDRPIVVDPAGFKPGSPGTADQHSPTVTVSSGATWSEVHHALSAYGLAPLVHQSSPHFTVGGSLSVNCHGRDPRQGPLSSTVNWIEVWAPQGPVRASRTENADLFRAALGGYGSCGPILQANLRVGPNLMLWQAGYTRSAAWYADHLLKLANAQDAEHKKIHLHYGWLQCISPTDLFDKVLVVDYKDMEAATCPVNETLKVEDWGDTEMLRAAWAAGRQGDPGLRKKIWELVAKQLEGGSDSRLNWMRAAISFTSHRGSAETDILQEYFVPVDRFDEMRRALQAIFKKRSVNVLSATVRLVRQDMLPVNLSYCAGGTMACIAVDASIRVEGEPRQPHAAVGAWVNEAIAAAGKLGGTYYLPYYRFAGTEVFRAQYKHWTAQQEAIGKYNASRRWWNSFLQAYF